MSVYLHFPSQSNKFLPLCDVNWGAQDQSVPDPSSPLEPLLFANISLSGFIIFFNGQLHWISKQQRITARSSVEVEIYATDKCVKNVLRLKHLIMDSDVTNISPLLRYLYKHSTTTVYVSVGQNLLPLKAYNICLSTKMLCMNLFKIDNISSPH